jgi:CIC family chloride channel protein
MREVVLFFPLLGVACGAMSALFVRVHFAVGDAVRALVARGRVPAAAVPWVAGALVGGAVVASGGLLVGTGHVAVPIEAFGRLAWWALVLLAVGKIAITALTLQGGGSGGLFTPSLFVGAATGGAVGAALHALFPGLPIAPASYALVGMGAVIAGATGAPITGILLVFEMTNDYAIMPALMLSVVISHVVARRLGRDNLYSGWLRRRGEHIEHGRDRDVLAGLRVSDAYDPSPVVLRDDARVADIVARLGDHDQTLYPVVDEDERLVGVLTFADLGVVARADHALDDVLLAADLAQPTEVLAPDESLLSAVRRMGLRGVSALPVVEPATDRLLGLVQRGSVLAVYERAVAAGAGEGGAPPR